MRGDGQDLGGHLHTVDDRLWIEQCDAVALAEQLRYAALRHLLRTAAGERRGLRHEFERRWTHGPGGALASLKANYVIAVRQLLNDEGLGCDVFGDQRARTALRAGVPADRISVNGSAKSDGLLRSAVMEGAAITLDSERELDAVIAITTALNKKARIRLRLRPDYPALTEPSDFFPGMAIRDAAQLYKPGIEPTAAHALGRRALSEREPRAHGPDDPPRPTQRAIPLSGSKWPRDLGRWSPSFCEAWAPWRPRELDIGGGLPAPRDPTHPDRRPAAAIDQYAEGITNALGGRPGCGWDPARGIVLQIEPGRSLFADAGLHLSHVVHVKTQTRPVPATWIEVDTTEMFMPDLLIEHAHFKPVFAIAEWPRPPVGPAHHRRDLVRLRPDCPRCPRPTRSRLGTSSHSSTRARTRMPRRRTSMCWAARAPFS